jgi:hypothetical protein
VAEGVRGAAQEGHVQDTRRQDQQLDGGRPSSPVNAPHQEALRLLEIPQRDVRWPLGGWLKFTNGTPLDLANGLVLGMANYVGPNNLTVIVTCDRTPRWGPLLHASISHRRRDPFWDEIKAMREAFFPADIDAMMVLPQAGDYINLHEHCFHLWQTPQAWGLK